MADLVFGPRTTRERVQVLQPIFSLQESNGVSDQHSIVDSIRGALVPVHTDGYKFVVGFALIALVLGWLWSPLGWLGAIATAWCAYFFRDPPRATPLRDGLIIAPADGRVSAVEQVAPPSELKLGSDPRTRVSIFLSVFDVHINRAPVAGKITHAVYVPGLFLNAELDKASKDNERQALVIETATGAAIGVVQIAGLIARRIVTFMGEGHTVAAGERFGLIRFGSRVDVYLPPGHGALVAAGQRAVGGETVLADLGSDEGARQVRVA